MATSTLLGGVRAVAPAASTEGRAPDPAYDNADAGYAAGHAWAQPDGRLWKASLSDTTGRLVWRRGVLRPPAAALAGDAAAGLVAAYGMRRVVAAYGTGPAIDVVRSSDSAALTVAFLADGRLDMDAALAFIRGTTGRISKWYDQSGNGHHAVQTTATNRPWLTPLEFFGAAPGAMFDNGVTSNGTVTNYTSPQSIAKVRNWLALPATLTGLSANALTVVALACFGHATRNQPLVELSADTGNAGVKPVCFGHLNGTGSGNALTAVVPLSTNTAVTTTRTLAGSHPPLSPSVVAMTGSGTNTLSLHQDDRATFSVNALGGTRLQGGMIGGTTVFADGNGDPDYGYNVQGALLIFNAGLPAAALADVRDALYADFRLQPQRRGTWIADGDSITEGAAAAWFQSWPRQAAPLLARRTLAYDAGISGGTFTSQLGAAQAKWTPLLAAAAPFKLATCALGSNDLAANATASTLWTNLQTWLAAARAAAADALLVPCTLIPRSNLSGAKETERLAYNALVRSGAAGLGCAGVIDFAADPVMAASATPGGSYDATLSFDGTHPTTAGYAQMAAVAGAAINRMFPL